MMYDRVTIDGVTHRVHNHENVSFVGMTSYSCDVMFTLYRSEIDTVRGVMFARPSNNIVSCILCIANERTP